MLMRGLHGVHDAFTWLTVAPLPQPRGDFDRRRAGTIIAAVPVVGAVLGAMTAAVAFGLAHTDLPALLIGTIVVAVLALATRGMHLDGLADTVDGLGSYGDPQRVRQIMRSGDVGPFGAATLAATVLGQSLAFGTLTADGRWAALAAAIFVGRAVVPMVCRSGLPAANPDGFGALVAGTQRLSIVLWSAAAITAAAGVGLLSSPTAAIQYPVTAALVVAFAWAFSRHAARRAGGLTGDVIGATIELSTTLMVVGLLV